MSDFPKDLRQYPIHLGLGARAEAQPAFTGMAWYADYAARTAADRQEGRLVGMHDFTEDWDSWEMHPAGEEVVVCLSGEMTLVQEMPDGRIVETRLAAGQYAINPAGIWHTANIASAATALFITAGEGTDGRPR